MTEEQEVKWADMTVYHIPESLARRFKEFCRLHANNKYGIGLEVLLNAYGEKENYLFLMNEFVNLRDELIKLKEEVALLRSGEDDDKVVKTFGGVRS